MAKSAVKQAPQMVRTWLVQRLEKPHQFEIGGKPVDNPFSFGGGLRNGGLSPEAMDLLRPVFSFDYMGSAEFEFGAVPEALQRIAEFANYGMLEAYSFDIALRDVKPHFREPKGFKVGDEAKRVYMLAPHDWMPEVEDRIRLWAREGSASSLKGPTRIESVLRPDPEPKYEETVAGWLELDNGFMFFTDEHMFRSVAEIFGVEA